jgi:hypothetical protein
MAESERCGSAICRFTGNPAYSIPSYSSVFRLRQRECKRGRGHLGSTIRDLLMNRLGWISRYRRLNARSQIRS